MPSSCGAYGCTNCSGKNKEISFHNLPSETKSTLRSKWLQNIRRDGKLPKTLTICSQHFENDCFERDLKVIELLMAVFLILYFNCGVKRYITELIIFLFKAELMGGTPRKILKEDAVYFVSPNLQRKGQHLKRELSVILNGS